MPVVKNIQGASDIEDLTDIAASESALQDNFNAAPIRDLILA